jgi:hypothetical protein
MSTTQYKADKMAGLVLNANKDSFDLEETFDRHKINIRLDKITNNEKKKLVSS